MLNTIRNIFAPPVFEKEEDNLRAMFINGYAWISIFLILIAAPFSLSSITFNFSTIIVTVGALVAMFATLYLLRKGRVGVSGAIVTTAGWLLITLGAVAADGVRGSSMAGYIALALLASIILSLMVGVIVIIASTIMLWVLAGMEVSGYIIPNTTSGPFTYALTLSVIFIIIAVLIYISTNSLRDALKRATNSEEGLREDNKELQALTQTLEQRVDERTRELKGQTRQLEAIADVARFVASIRELDRLLPAVAQFVSERFGFYHVGIFLLDDAKEFALLQAANSEGGKNMLAGRHRLKVGEQGIVGYVTLSGNPRIALDVGEDAVFFNNPDLPDTHSEVALPLTFGTEIIGALDIQSTESNAFTEDDVDVFSILADQVSVAIQNTRSLEQAQRSLQELEIATRRTTSLAWEGFTKTLRTRGYRYDGIKPEPLKDSAKPVEDMDALIVPVQLREKTLGHLKLRAIEKSHTWSEDELAIINSTAERVAIALDSARLLDDAQKRASRETFLSGMAAKLGASFQMDSILRDTVEELGQTLEGSTVSFQLINPSAPPSAGDDHGNSNSRKTPE